MPFGFRKYERTNHWSRIIVPGALSSVQTPSISTTTIKKILKKEDSSGKLQKRVAERLKFRMHVEGVSIFQR